MIYLIGSGSELIEVKAWLENSNYDKHMRLYDAVIFYQLGNYTIWFNYQSDARHAFDSRKICQRARPAKI